MSSQLGTILMVGSVSCLLIVSVTGLLLRLGQCWTEYVEIQRSFSQSLSSIAHSLEQSVTPSRATKTERPPQ